mgnify:CR=1 FL=1
MTRSSNDPKITIYGTKVAETARAVRFTIRAIGTAALDSPKSEWFPLSQVSKIVTNPDEAGRDYLVVSEWIMKQKELLDSVKSPDPRMPSPEIDDDEDSYNDIPWED